MTTPNLFKGVMFTLLGCFAISAMSACVKTLPSDVPTSTIVFFQFAISLLFTLPSLMKNGVSLLKSEHPYVLSIRAATALFSSAALFFALKYIPLVNAVLLQNAAPLFVPLIALIWLRQRMANILWIGVIIGFIGVIFILKPDKNILNPAALIGVCAGILSSISIVAISVLKKTEQTQKILFYTYLPGTLVTAPFVLFHHVHLNLLAIFSLIGVGVFMYLGQLFITAAFAYTKAHVVALFCYSVIIFSGLLGWIFWHHVPDAWATFGIVLVSLGGIMTILIEQRLNILKVKEIPSLKIVIPRSETTKQSSNVTA